MADGKASPGQFFKLPPADVWNAMIDAGLAYRTQRRTGIPAISIAIPTDLIHLKNNTGGAVVAGRVLEIDSALPTTVTREAMWFNGATPAPDGADTFAITLRQMPSAAIDICQVAGMAFVRLNVNQVQQTWADVDSSSTLLQSKWHGRAKIIWKSTASTGEQDAVVQLGHDFRGPINVVCTTGITGGMSASCAVWWAGSSASPASNITCHLNWMDAAGSLSAGAEAQAYWHPDQQKYVISNAEC